jgi:putative glycerol-1-phosphate prenyltransferase
LFKKNHKKKIILIDPDKWKEENLKMACEYINNNENIAFVFIGGSIIKSPDFHKKLEYIKMNLKKPLLLFAGNSYQINLNVDAFFIPFPLNTYDYNYFHNELLRNAFLLSQKPVYITGYLLLGSNFTSAYILSKAYDISENYDIILAFVKFCEIMKFSSIYLEGGSGSNKIVSIELLKFISEKTKLPIIVGGGLKNLDVIENVLLNGADYVIIGNYIEENVNFIKEL